MEIPENLSIIRQNFSQKLGLAQKFKRIAIFDIKRKPLFAATNYIVELQYILQKIQESLSNSVLTKKSKALKPQLKQLVWLVVQNLEQINTDYLTQIKDLVKRIVSIINSHEIMIIAYEIVQIIEALSCYSGATQLQNQDFLQLLCDLQIICWNYPDKSIAYPTIEKCLITLGNIFVDAPEIIPKFLSQSQSLQIIFNLAFINYTQILSHVYWFLMQLLIINFEHTSRTFNKFEDMFIKGIIKNINRYGKTDFGLLNEILWCLAYYSQSNRFYYDLNDQILNLLKFLINQMQKRIGLIIPCIIILSNFLANIDQYIQFTDNLTECIELSLTCNDRFIIREILVFMGNLVLISEQACDKIICSTHLIKHIFDLFQISPDFLGNDILVLIINIYSAFEGKYQDFLIKMYLNDIKVILGNDFQKILPEFYMLNLNSLKSKCFIQ